MIARLHRTAPNCVFFQKEKKYDDEPRYQGISNASSDVIPSKMYLEYSHRTRMIMTAGAGLPTLASSERLQHLKGREPRAKTESRGNMNTIPPLTVSAAATCIRDQFTAENMPFCAVEYRRPRGQTAGLGWVLRLRSGS